jgi:DNA-binding MurR/RpiR family transcriptional regulator
MKHDVEITTYATDLTTRLARVSGARERAVADFLLREGPRVAAMSAREIAAAAGTSDATVVRTARSLGYANLRELRQALAARTDDTDLATRLHRSVDGTPAAHDVLARAAANQLAALDALLQRVTPTQFDAAVAALVAARHVWWRGIGPSAFVAEYGAFLSRRLGTPAGSFTHAGTDHADELLALAPDDAVVVLAYGRIHPTVPVLLERAAQIGASTVLVTDTARRRFADPPSVVLDAGRGAPELFATHGPTIVLVEALVLAIAASDADGAAASVETLNRLRQSIAGRRVDVDPA